MPFYNALDVLYIHSKAYTLALCLHTVAMLANAVRKAFKSSNAGGLLALRGVVTQTTSGSVVDDIVSFARSSNEVR